MERSFRDQTTEFLLGYFTNASTHVRLPNSNLARVLPAPSDPHDESVQQQGDESDLGTVKGYTTLAGAFYCH